MMWAALVLWVSPCEQPFTPWKKTSVSRCSVALKRSWGMQSRGLSVSVEVGGSPKPNRAQQVGRCSGPGTSVPIASPPGPCFAPVGCHPSGAGRASLPTLAPQCQPLAPRTFSQADLDPAGVPQLAVGCDAPVGIPSPGQQLPLAGGHRWLGALCFNGPWAEVGILRDERQPEPG